MKKKAKRLIELKKQKIKGGFADKSESEDFDSKQLKMGIKVEMEHTDDPKIAQEIAMDHLKEIPDYYTRLKVMEQKAKKDMKKSCGVATEDNKTKKIAKLIEQHNRKKLNKSYDFRDVTVSIDSADQKLAEDTACPKLIKYLKSAVENSLNKVPLKKGSLVMTEKQPGLYNAFFQDAAGQVVEKFDDNTIEMLAKNLEMKNLYIRPEASGDASSGSVVRIKYGDLEFEVRKSINDFVNDFRASKYPDKQLIKKSIGSWKKSVEGVMSLENKKQAAEELSKNWDMHKESFFQIMHGIKKGNK